MAKHAEPVVLELIRCEGFWATDRPRWSLSRTPSDGYLQVGRICLFPAIIDHNEIVLPTCTSRRDTTWDTALTRGLTLMPKPFNELEPDELRQVGSLVILRQAWRARREHSGLVAAFRAERAEAKEQAKQESERATADHQAATDAYHAQRENAQRTFRERHRQEDT
jgi:hypothetical protein